MCCNRIANFFSRFIVQPARQTVEEVCNSISILLPPNIAIPPDPKPCFSNSNLRRPATASSATSRPMRAIALRHYCRLTGIFTFGASSPKPALNVTSSLSSISKSPRDALPRSPPRQKAGSTRRQRQVLLASSSLFGSNALPNKTGNVRRQI
jgi:hypothetical protein